MPAIEHSFYIAIYLLRGMKILLIEDDHDDIELLEGALADNGVLYSIAIIHDGKAAVEYIKNCMESPDIIVLDYNLPKIHGREVLKEIKSADKFKNLPLLILTTSSSKDDIEYAYKYGADKYLIKPISTEGIKEMANVIVSLGTKRKPI